MSLAFVLVAAELAVPSIDVRTALGTYRQGNAIVELLEVDGALAASMDQKTTLTLKTAGARRYVTDSGKTVQLIGRPGMPVQALLLEGRLMPRTDIGAETDARMQGWFRSRNIEAVRKAAMAARPTVDPAATTPPDLVDVAPLDPTLKVRLAYAGPANFGGVAFYQPEARLYLQRPVAEALVRASRRVRAQGYGLWLHDGYRPWYVTKMFWDAMPDAGRGYVADPAKGSRHNRGAAIDLSLYDLRSGKLVTMPSRLDEPSHRSFADAPAGTSDQRRRRAILRRAMEAEGFTVLPDEWWHFDYQNWRRFPILNVVPDASAPRAAQTQKQDGM